MAGKALQMECPTQCSNELACQTLAAFATNLPAALWLWRLQLLIIMNRICH